MNNRFRVKFTTAENKPMVLTEVGFAPEGMFKPLLLDGTQADMLMRAMTDILSYACVPPDTVQELCIHQEYVPEE